MAEPTTPAGDDAQRGGFAMRTLAGGFAPAAAPVPAHTAIATDAVGLRAGEVHIPVDGGAMPAYRAAPAGGGPFPVIVVAQEIFGVHEYIRDVCRRLAKLGYLAVAPELYARQGDPSTYTDIPTLYAAIVARVPDAQVMADIDRVVAWAAASGGDTARLGITGFCWGGRMTWLYAAHNPAVRAAVAWYGRLVGERTALAPAFPVDIAAGLQVPVLGLYGGADTSIPLDTVERMQQALANNAGAGGSSQFVVYPDAPHAFHADYRPGYRKEAAQDGWTRAIAWMRQFGVV